MQKRRETTWTRKKTNSAVKIRIMIQRIKYGATVTVTTTQRLTLLLLLVYLLLLLSEKLNLQTLHNNRRH
jgi:hypothetical protein